MASASSASHGRRARAKEGVKRTREIPKESPKEPKVRSKVPKAHTRVKHRKTGLSGLENSQIRDKLGNSGIWHKHVPLTIHGIYDGGSPDELNDGWSFDERNDDWSSVMARRLGSNLLQFRKLTSTRQF